MAPTIENLHPSPHPEPRTLTLPLSLKKETVSQPPQSACLVEMSKYLEKNSCLYSQIVAWIPRSGEVIMIYYSPFSKHRLFRLKYFLNEIALIQTQLTAQSSLQGWYSLRISHNKTSWEQTIILAIGQLKSRCRENKLPNSRAPQFC